jgi:RNA polymerase sigma factor (sigma-70 family)
MEAIALGRLDDTYRTHGRQIHRYIKSKVADDEEAEDILHEVFTRAAISVNASEHIENLVAWLFRSASNRIVDWYRRKFRSDISADDESVSFEEILSNSQIDLHDDMIRDSVIEELYRAIDELPDAQREVILRQAIGGESFREISEDTGVSVNTLLARKRYAVAALRKRLQAMQETIQDLIT